MSMKVEREAFTDEKRMRMRSKRSTSHENGVIISIYVETPIIRTRDKNDAIKRINSEPKPNSLIFSKPPRTTALRSCGYDRRAQLLAYAQELRHANNSKLHQEGSIKKSFMPRSKKQRWSPSSSFLRWFHPAKRRWRYEHIVTDEQSKVDNRRKTTRGRRYSRICRRLRILLKELSSCTCQGNKAYDDLD